MLAKFRPLMATAAKARSPPAVAASTATDRDEHVHYKHTDGCHHLRWTAKESYEYMYARPWSSVLDFYAELVRTGAGSAGLAKLFAKDEVAREFHPNFAAKWRRYMYIFPLDEDAKLIFGDEHSSEALENSEHNIKPQNFDVAKVDETLRKLSGKTLSYKMFARDTQASRSVGPPTECFMFHSRAAVAKLFSSNEDCKEGMRVMCVELVANRFLRKMVRVLVATAIREAATGAGEDALLNLMEATDRRATAPPAPPEGLCLVDVGYKDFDKQRCFIVD
nr:unnamed protein product [Digitaria exilis]